MNRGWLLNLGRISYLELVFSFRIPASVIFIFLLPSISLLLFAYRYDDKGFIVSGMVALVTAFSTMQGVGQVASTMRSGIWQTFQAAFYPEWLYLAGVVVSRLIRTLLITTFLLLLAYAAFGYWLDGSLGWHLVLVTFGAVAFACLGLLVAYLPKSPKLSGQIINLTMLLMMIISGIFFEPADFLRTLSYLSPLTFLTGLIRANATDASIAGTYFAVAVGALLLWTLLSAGLALHFASIREED